jgi:Na+-transporting NADH:ubiquinone oxidoreductase subunit NqrB
MQTPYRKAAPRRGRAIYLTQRQVQAFRMIEAALVGAVLLACAFVWIGMLGGFN